MIRSDLILRLSALNPHLYERDCVKLVDAIIGRITDALAAGDRVEIRGFGSFSVKEQRARQGRNPRTGEQVSVPTKTVIAFKPSREMRGRLNPNRSATSVTGAAAVPPKLPENHRN